MASARTRANLALTCAILTEVTATLSLKGAIYLPWLIAVVAAGYAASFVFLAVCLRAGKPIGVAYGVWGACGVLITAILSWVIFHESITPLMAVGFLLIAGGVAWLETSSSHTAEAGESAPAAPPSREGDAHVAR